MEFTAAAIAGFLKGTIEGDPNVKVNTVAKIEEGHEGALSFLSNPKYENYIYTTRSSIVLVNKDFLPSKKISATLIRVADAYSAFASLLTMVEQAKPVKKGIHPAAVIEPTAKVGEDVYIGPYAYLGENCSVGNGCKIYPNVYIGDNCKIGNNCIINPGVTIYHECIVGNNCTIHAGTVIGSDGFGFAPMSGGDYQKIPQIGNVLIGDDVEIGANVTIDRSTMGSTIVSKGVKLDNLIQIAHNVEIGENTVIAAHTGIAGSTKIGKNCMFGGQVAINGHIKIANGTKAGAQAGLAQQVDVENTILQGTPAIPYRQFYRSSVVFSNLPDLKRKIDALEREVEALKKK
jgi:UDP-3-O-[3-hydroxymyristoyl] glucosamine N-acyltransferase